MTNIFFMNCKTPEILKTNSNPRSTKILFFTTDIKFFMLFFKNSPRSKLFSLSILLLYNKITYQVNVFIGNDVLVLISPIILLIIFSIDIVIFSVISRVLQLFEQKQPLTNVGTFFRGC